MSEPPYYNSQREDRVLTKRNESLNSSNLNCKRASGVDSDALNRESKAIVLMMMTTIMNNGNYNSGGSSVIKKKKPPFMIFRTINSSTATSNGAVFNNSATVKTKNKPNVLLDESS